MVLNFEYEPCIFDGAHNSYTSAAVSDGHWSVVTKDQMAGWIHVHVSCFIGRGQRRVPGMQTAAPGVTQVVWQEQKEGSSSSRFACRVIRSTKKRRWQPETLEDPTFLFSGAFQQVTAQHSEFPMRLMGTL